MPRYDLRRYYSVDEYHAMIESEILTGDDKLELLDGMIVEKMRLPPPHTTAIQKLWHKFDHVLSEEWQVRVRSAVTLETSEPEPEVVIAEEKEDYWHRHPGPEDVGLIVEVPRMSFDKFRAQKERIYAQARISECWVVDVPAREIEVWRGPRQGDQAVYQFAERYDLNASIPLVLRGKKIADIPVRELV